MEVFHLVTLMLFQQSFAGSFLSVLDARSQLLIVGLYCCVANSGRGSRDNRESNRLGYLMSQKEEVVYATKTM